MIKLEQEELDVMDEGAIVAFAEISAAKQSYFKKDIVSSPIIREFDGVVCDFEFPEGGGYFTKIPLSKKDSLASDLDTRRKSVTITIMRGWVEYEITDDWGSNHYLYIRTSESEIIFKSILAYKEQYGIIALLK